MRNLLSTFLLLAATMAARAAPPDSLRARPWYVPHHALGQFAGGQGLVALGLGYTHRRLDLDVLAGYVPGRFSITPMGIYTLKATFSPWQLPLGTSRWQLRPLSTGGMVSHTASAGFNKTRDSKYEPGYYWWSAHTRLAGFVGGRLAYRLAGPRPRYASLYYELGTNDLYLTSIWHNMGQLPLASILTLGVGVKIDL